MTETSLRGAYLCIQTIQDLHNFTLCNFTKFEEKITNYVSGMCFECFRDWLKAQCHEGCGRVLLGDKTGGGAVMLLPNRFRCAGVWISAGPLCMYIIICMPHSGLRKVRRAPNLPERNCCVIRGVSVDTEESGIVLLRTGSKSTVFVTRR